MDKLAAALPDSLMDQFRTGLMDEELKLAAQKRKVLVQRAVPLLTEDKVTGVTFERTEDGDGAAASGRSTSNANAAVSPATGEGDKPGSASQGDRRAVARKLLLAINALPDQVVNPRDGATGQHATSVFMKTVRARRLDDLPTEAELEQEQADRAA